MSITTQPREIQLLILRHINVRDLVRVSETCHSLKEVARDPSLWKKLTLTYERIKDKTEACRNHVRRCSKLREIFIVGQEDHIRSDKIMSVVMKAKTTLKLVSIKLGRFAGLSNSSFEKIGASMNQLTHLDINGRNLGLGGVASLSRLKELKVLKLPGFVWSGDNFDFVHDGLVELFGKIRKLEKVEIQSCSHFPSDKVVESLVNNNSNLQHIDFSTPGPANHFYPSGITRLVSKCSKLKYANFKDTNVTDNALAVMSKNCPHLEYLNVTGCQRITEEGLERFVNLASAPYLKQLHVSHWYYDSDWDFLNRAKKDLPSLMIVMKKEFHDDDDSYDSEDDDDDGPYYFF